MEDSNLLQWLDVHAYLDLPDYVYNGTQYIARMGSQAYGCNSDDSDLDIYAFCMPNYKTLDPLREGFVLGFDHLPEFKVYQKHNIELGSTVYDINVYSLMNYMKLVTDNNPNMVDSLFVSDNDVLYITPIAELFRDNRKMFLHTGIYNRFANYADTELKKNLGSYLKKFVDGTTKDGGYPLDLLSHITTETDVKSMPPLWQKVRTAYFQSKNQNDGRFEKRIKEYIEHGYNPKSMYHTIRLLTECYDFLTTGDCDLKANSDLYKEIRSGAYDEAEMSEMVANKKFLCSEALTYTKLPSTPDKNTVRAFLMDAISYYY